VPTDDGKSIRAAIVAMNAARVIGRDGTLPWHYSEDLKRFKRLTTGTTIVMGRNTFESIGSKPLPNRDNRVVTRAQFANVACFDSVESAIKDCTGDIWFIGGAKLYQAALDYCDFIDVMWVPDEVTGEDLVYFPELSQNAWRAGPKTPLAEDNRLICQRFYRQ
jgi:dihydrofolate reductase